eukprot:scaffold92238_cov54-Attheya_sp.AAC.1
MALLIQISVESTNCSTTSTNETRQEFEGECWNGKVPTRTNTAQHYHDDQRKRNSRYQQGQDGPAVEAAPAAEAVKPPAAAAAPLQRAASPPSRGPPAGGVRAANVRADVEAASNQKEYGVSLPMPETCVRCGRCQTTFALTIEDLGSRGNGA